MSSLLIKTSRLLAVASLLFISSRAAVAGCHADNCYRALFPCQSPGVLATASAFCATVTAGGTTATNYPSKATAFCGTTPDRYISACSCGPTCTSTTTTPTPTPSCAPSGGLIPNGDFECGLAPWTTQVPDPAATVALTSPGNTGNTAFEVHLRRAPATPENGVSARIISGTVHAAANVPGLFKFSSYFDNPDAGFIGVLINGQPVYTVDARDALPVGEWHSAQFYYTPQTDDFVVTFEFIFGPYPSIDKIDTVSYNWLH